MELLLAFLFVCFAIFLVVAIPVYNDLNPLWHRVEEARANIEVVFNKRAQLTSRLSEIASRYVGHERTMFLQISADRAWAPTGQGVGFFAGLAASFPELRADQTYLRLMNDLTGLETDVQVKFESYNAIVREYNAKRASLPHLFCADLLGFSAAARHEQSAPRSNRMRIRGIE